MKIVKVVIGLCVALVLFSKLGLLNNQGNELATKVVDTTKMGLSKLSYDGKPVKDLTISDIGKITSDTLNSPLAKDTAAVASIVKENIGVVTTKADNKLITEITFTSEEASIKAANVVLKGLTGHELSETDLKNAKRLGNVKLIIVFDKSNNSVSYTMQKA